jgi:WhiB family redox-sensing transcriptional regulator
MALQNVLLAMVSNWMAVGNCNNHPPAVFFPSDGVGVEIAKKICATCPAQEPCLEYALANRIDHGVWGGTSERQRRRILKARRTLADVVAAS